jgi:hypothetical protein
MWTFLRRGGDTSHQKKRVSLFEISRKSLNLPDHGTSGPLHLSYADQFEKGLTDVFQAAEELGLGVNSGKLIGFLAGDLFILLQSHAGKDTDSSFSQM